MQLDSLWYRSATTDIYASMRPNPAGSNPDIGACENHRASPLTEIADWQSTLPIAFGLDQNYPNPFNPTTAISYQLPANSNSRIAIYDLLGREVAVLVNERKGPGTYTVEFDAANLPSGMYLCRLTAGSFSQVRKLILVK